MTQAQSLKNTAGRFLLAIGVMTLMGCDPAGQANRANTVEPGVQEPTRDGPEGAAPGTCWGKTVSPAVIQTVSQQVQVKPAKVNPDGTLAALPVYRSEERQEIVTPRRDNWFETPCPDVLTADFVSSLQRALLARGIFKGEVVGEMDQSTRSAVRRFQISIQGPDSEVLALDTARTLGLIAVERS